ncbi:MAG: peptidylprolyl isomerase [Nitrospirota bacterium]|jgi:FKBP-type peptidyl-prolyl cis-trans isomerase 2
MPCRKTIVVAAIVVFAMSLAFSARAAEGADSKKETDVVAKGSEVKVHYTLTVDGNVVDKSQEGSALQFRVGEGRLIPGFEKAVMGMKEGQKKSFEVKPEEGYGAVNPEAFRTVSRDQLPPDVEPEAGMVLYAKGPGGQDIPLRISEVSDESVVLDLNHPLAGKTLNFDIEVVEIE